MVRAASQSPPCWALLALDMGTIDRRLGLLSQTTGDLNQAGFVEIVIEAVGFGVEANHFLTHQFIDESSQLGLRLDHFVVRQQLPQSCDITWEGFTTPPSGSINHRFRLVAT